MDSGSRSDRCHGPRRAALRDQHAGGQIPRVEVLLEIGVEASTGDEAEVDRGRAEATDIAYVGQEEREASGLPGAPFGGVAEPGRDERA
jgi:hypothetical protein